MPIVTVKNKYQIVIPGPVRKQARIRIGDLLEAGIERGKITLTPKSLVDRGIAEGLEDIRRGRVIGPFDTVEEMVASLKKGVKGLVGRKQKPRAQ